jgi:hypothetical protein
MRSVRWRVLGGALAAVLALSAAIVLPGGLSSKAADLGDYFNMSGTLTYIPATANAPAKAVVKASGMCHDEGITLIPCSLSIRGPIAESGANPCSLGGGAVGTIQGPGTLSFGSTDPDSSPDLETVATFFVQDFPTTQFNWAITYSGADDPGQTLTTGGGGVALTTNLSCDQGNNTATTFNIAFSS